MSTPFRPIHVAILATLAGLAFASISSLAASEAGADAPLELGSKHVGMTSEGLSDAEQAAQTERRVDAAIRDSEWTDDDDGEGALSFACPDPVAAATGPAPDPVSIHAIGVEGYDSCVEVAIRGGNGFRAASGVCQTLYPEWNETAELDETPALEEAPELEEAPPLDEALQPEEAPQLDETARVDESLSGTPTQY